MKKFSIFNEAVKDAKKLDIQPNTLNYLSVEDLDNYLKVAGKFISKEAKEIINWLKINNDSYLHLLDPNAKYDNALAGFYCNGVPKDKSLNELYKTLGKVIKSGLMIEIPVFQTKDQFDAIVNKTISPDEVLIGDISSTTDGLRINKDNDFTPVAKANRDKLFKKYQPLIHKIVNQFVGKTNVSAEDLYSSACEGFVYAMNTFGHPKKRDEDGKWVEADKNEQHINYTFGQYAAYAIRNTILGAIENSHLVRIPKSEQKRQRDELGFNIKTNTISGNKTIGHDSDGNGKELFDYIDNAENGGKSIDNEDLQKLWKEAYTELESKFSKEDIELFYRNFKLNGFDSETKNQQELAAEYGLKKTTAHARISKIINYISSNKKMLDIFTNILELTHECKQNEYEEQDQFNEVSVIKGCDIKNIYGNE